VADSHSEARERLNGYGLAALAALCWATGGLSATWLFTPLDAVTRTWPFPPLGIAIDPAILSASRALIAFMMLLAYLLLARRSALRITLRDVPFLAFFGVAGLAMVHFTYFKTISLTSVATAILLEYLAPVIVLIIAVTLLGDRFTWSLPAAVVLSVSGCALVVGAIGGTGLAVSPEGLAWGLASAVFFAGYTLMGRWAAHRYSSSSRRLGRDTFWLESSAPAPVLRAFSDGRHRGVTFVAFVAVCVRLFQALRPIGNGASVGPHSTVVRARRGAPGTTRQPTFILPAVSSSSPIFVGRLSTVIEDLPRRPAFGPRCI